MSRAVVGRGGGREGEKKSVMVGYVYFRSGEDVNCVKRNSDAS
jgi:hypothetical protein